MSEWTKGDWEADGNMGVFAAGGGLVAQCYYVSSAITVEQAQANARLIAAAPTMAEALENLLAHTEGVTLPAAAHVMREKARAALSLAKGEDRNG